MLKLKFIMSVCILGNGLTSLTLAKSLVNKGVSVDIVYDKKKDKINYDRTIGISKINLEFFNKEILNINKLSWNIDKIEIYSENLNNEKLLNFENKDQNLFSMIKNHELKNYLFSELKKNRYTKFRGSTFNLNNHCKKYDLIINCDPKSKLTNKFFYKKQTKDYKSFAFTTLINHKKIKDNQTACQIFTKNGPLAFLPISNEQTSVVYSVKGRENINFKDSIVKYNIKYDITKIQKSENFSLQSVDLISYHYKNILAFGDILHRIHPLAGQGFNMSIRDIKELIKLIKFRIDHGLNLDSSVCLDFEKKTKHKNYLFTNGIDLIYEFFNLESKLNNKILGKSLQFIGNNKIVNKIFTKYADKGITI